MRCVDVLIVMVMICLVILSAILQGLGTFGSEWITGITCYSVNPKPSCCNISLCEKAFHLKELDETSYIVQVTSFAILMVPIGVFVLGVCCSEKKEEGTYTVIGGFTVLVYPIAGILSFAGCMVIVSKYSSHTPGSSFYQCLGCSLYVLVMTGISICLIRYSNKHKYSSTPPSTYAMNMYHGGGAAAPYGVGPPAVTALDTTLEESVAAHHQETGGFMMLMKSIKIYSIASNHHEGDE